MQVDPLAIEAHEKGELETDTIHTIDMDRRKVKLVKRSRVNNDLVVELNLDEEFVELLPPGDRPKKSLAVSNGPDHLRITSTMMSVNGEAMVSDTKTLVNENGTTLLRQELTITNTLTRATNTTVRFFLPYLKTPPHLESS